MTKALLRRVEKIESRGPTPLGRLTDEQLDERIRSAIASFGGPEPAAEILREMNRPDLVRVLDEFSVPPAGLQ